MKHRMKSKGQDYLEIERRTEKIRGIRVEAFF
jgi:hypothetical protein